MANQLLSTVERRETLPESYIRPESDRPRLAEVTTDNNIPLIDLASPDKQLVVDQIGQACRTYGFFQVINHGISNDLLEKVMAVGLQFFRLPAEEKVKLYSDEPSKKIRLSTSFNVKKETVHNWRDYLRLHCHPLEEFLPEWPSNPESFKEIVSTYCREVRLLGLRLLGVISLSLGLEEDYIEKVLGEQEQHMAVNYYPQCPEPDLTYGLPKHTDPNALTILLQDPKVAGLQVLKDGNRWIAVNPRPNALVINLGDQLQALSNGAYESVWHRAVVNAAQERMSVASFLCPCNSTVIGPAPSLVAEGGAPAYRSYTYDEYYKKFWSRNLDQERCLELFTPIRSDPMFPMVDDPSAVGAGAMISSSFPDADAYGNGDSDDIDFPADPNTNASFSAAAGAPAGGGGGAGSGERRPLFQRLWTDEDEIVILRAFAEFTVQRGTAFASHQYDTTPFYEDMRSRLQTGFTKNQLVEKLRRLKRKYRNCVDRLRVAGPNFSFRSPHEQAVFEIARTIWRPASDKHGRDSDDEGNDDGLSIDAAAVRVNGESVKSPSSRPRRGGRRRRTSDIPAAEALPLPPPPMPAMTSEDALPSFPQTTAMDSTITMDPAAAGLPGLPAVLSAAATAATTGTAENPILASLFKEMFRSMLNISPNTAPLGLELPPAIPGMPMDGEKWRQQRILELEVYLRRIALLQDQAQAALEELRSAPPHHGAGGMNK